MVIRYPIFNEKLHSVQSLMKSIRGVFKVIVEK